MSLETQTKLGMERLATIAKNLKNKQGDLSTLSTTEKGSLVGAINEAITMIAGIDDTTASTSTTFSGTKVNELIAAAITGVLGGAGTDDDTLAELAAQITGLAQADNGLVSAAASQTFSTAQQTQARSNIGAVSQVVYDALILALGNLNRDFVADIDAIYNA